MSPVIASKRHPEAGQGWGLLMNHKAQAASSSSLKLCVDSLRHCFLFFFLIIKVNVFIVKKIERKT